MSKLYNATISKARDDDGFWRVFYYAPGMGFETGNSVYTGRSQWREKSQAEDAVKRYLASRLASEKLTEGLSEAGFVTDAPVGRSKQNKAETEFGREHPQAH